MQGWFVLAISAAYVTALFLIAWWGDRRSAHGPLVPANSWAAAVSYCLTLAVYNTSWSFYGSVGRAATSGLDFITIYLGPTLVLLLAQFKFLLRMSAAESTSTELCLRNITGAKWRGLMSWFKRELRGFVPCRGS